MKRKTLIACQWLYIIVWKAGKNLHFVFHLLRMPIVLMFYPFIERVKYRAWVFALG